MKSNWCHITNPFIHYMNAFIQYTLIFFPQSLTLHIVQPCLMIIKITSIQYPVLVVLIYSYDEHRPDNIWPPSEPRLFLSLLRNLLHLTEKIKFWSSIFLWETAIRWLISLQLLREHPLLFLTAQHNKFFPNLELQIGLTPQFSMRMILNLM